MINLIKKDKKGLGNIKSLAWLLILFFMIVASCGQRKKIVYTPRGYDITNPVKYTLGLKLNEISGICWINDTLIIANNDEAGKLFAINPRDMDNLEYRNIKFGDKADYEDIVLVDSAIYILEAHGSIYKVTGYSDELTIRTELIARLPGTENEFETLYYDKDVHSLIMLCKGCHREKDEVRSAYRFDLATNQLITTPYYQIDMGRIKMIMDDEGIEFRPSAAAINPVDNKVYVVSPLGDLMVIMGKNGRVEQAFRISTLMFPQPEGITFASNGDMFISNEIGSEPAATLLKFPYKKPN